MYEQIKTFVRKNKKISNIYRKVIKADVVEQKFMDLEEKLIYKYIFQLEKRVEALEKRLEIPSLSPVILSSTEGEPNLDNPISQVATSSQLHSPIFNIWTERLNLPNYPNRKTWEFVYICQVLEKNKMISADKKGVGFGVGKDPIVAYLAKNRVNILATDLHTDEAKTAGWVDTNQHLNNVKDLNYRGITSNTNLKNHVKFRFVDMNYIPEDVQDYDFTWSACAFEHLGSIEKGFEFVKNSLKCLKPRGLAVHTTEFNVSSNDDTVDNQATVLFRKRDFEKLAAELQKDGHEVAFNFNTGNSSFDKYYDIPPYSDYTHLKLLIDKYVSTSIGLVIKKSE
jgi:hypothetical protein